jgi:hypothetical protein
MDRETLMYFKYEFALGRGIPMPKPKLDVFPHSQHTVQQFLHEVCKENVGALGKRNGEWEFGGEAGEEVHLRTRPEIIQILDVAEELGIIEPKSGEASQEGEGGFIPYQLSEMYWNKFDEFAS